jgi:hypothetical protein
MKSKATRPEKGQIQPPNREPPSPAPVVDPAPLISDRAASGPVSPRWSASAKLLVGLTAIALAGLVVIRFGRLLQLLVIAAIVAFLLVPLVRLIHQHARLSWRLSTHAVFLILILLLIVGFTATGLALAHRSSP